MPIREKLLLVLPGREIHDCLCTRCGSSLGHREVSDTRASQVWTPR